MLIGHIKSCKQKKIPHFVLSFKNSCLLAKFQSIPSEQRSASPLSLWPKVTFHGIGQPYPPEIDTFLRYIIMLVGHIQSYMRKNNPHFMLS